MTSKHLSKTSSTLSRNLNYIYLKIVFATFYQTFIFSPNDRPSKNCEKCFSFHLKTFCRSRDIQVFGIFSLPSHTFQIQKDK